MYCTRIILTIIFVLYFFSGCGDKSTPNSSNNDNSPNKSTKRGIAYNLTSKEDFEVISKGVSWWYNWGIYTSAPDNYYKTYSMEFIPMLWGGNTSNSDLILVENFIFVHPEIHYLLVMNEPNLTDQANRTPVQAAADWLKYEKLVSDLSARGRTISLVGPAMNWGTMAGYSDPVIWLDVFYSAYKTANENREPKIDYLAFHWYDYGLNAQLDRLKKYGKKSG